MLIGKLIKRRLHGEVVMLRQGFQHMEVVNTASIPATNSALGKG